MMSSSTKKNPSLYARKLLDKLRTLHSNTSLESRQTLANWMVFNRKKAQGMAEGMLLAVNNSTTATTTDGQEDPSSSRLMLLLRILHQVFIEGKDDSDTFQKSAQLRSILADVALIPLLQALAATTSSEQQYHAQVKEMIDQWKDYAVFDGPTVWDGYKKAWGRALLDASAAAAAANNANNTNKTKEVEGESNDSIMKDNRASSTEVQTNNSATIMNDDAPMDNVEGKEGEQSLSLEEGAQSRQSTSLTKEEIMDDSNNTDNGSLQKNGTSKEIEKDTTTKKEDATTTIESIPPSTTTALPADDNNNKNKEESQDGPSQTNQSPKRDSITSVTTSSTSNIEIDFDAEGVEEAEVEPTKFLEASKIIASLQIARDLGSDAAMNLSSALGSVPAEVEQACSTIYAKQQEEGGDEGTTTSIEELLSTEQLSNLPDEILDIDLDYARTSLQNYREAILQQRKARLQCLHLLLQSRCSFGSLDAARAFGCDDGSGEGMDIILEKLKKVKDKLIDAMALEGLDVEEDDTMKEEEEQLKPLSWFPGQTKESEDEPVSKKQKVA